MPQLHFYVPDQMADRIRQQAVAAGMSISQYLAEVVKRELQPEWPDGFFEEVVGGWQGLPLERPAQGEFDERKPLLFGKG
jgi:hypothetical protein